MTSGCILFRILGTPLRQRTPKFNFYHWLTDLHINQEPNPIPDDLGSWPMNPDCVYTKEKAANSEFLRLEIFYKQSQEKIWIFTNHFRIMNNNNLFTKSYDIASKT